ncbi:Hypothetical predicted protein [Lecanosticta acicola]|uniref:Uncharacterized protein n=1 Tax=Lecanosticta acicola TaxID=111012 RepID=A0AAI8YVQ5_9PEZI|nr:Hypothetical predicted protein [Lecanosticta acicola]
MAIRQYTREQLIFLRDSSLVAKPDNLPAIEQWIDDNATNGSVQQAKQPGSNKGGRLGGGAVSESSPMGSFSTGRPTMTGGRGRADREDISLGPPRTVFASSRNTVPKLSDFERSSGDTTSLTSRGINRKSMNNENEGARHERDSWMLAREKREEHRERGFGRHDKEDGERRNGFGDRHDPRWSSNREDRRNGDRPAGGWREREQQKRDQRDGDRGHAEKEPEWMENDPLAKQEQELGFDMDSGARTQEDFQKWKESMKNKKPKGVEPEAKPVQETPVQAAQPPPPAPEPKAGVAPLKLQEGFEGGLFSGWSGNATANPVSTPGATGSIKPTTGKPKTSRFASMFKPAAEEPPHPPPEETKVQQAANAMAKTSAEEQEGFNRVLQMLGSAKIAQEPPAQPPPPPPQESAPSSPLPVKTSGQNGTSAKPKSRFTSMFAQKSPAPQSPQAGNVPFGGDSMFGNEGRNVGDESANGFMAQRQEQQIPRTQGIDAATPAEPSGIPFNALREQQPRPMSGRNNLQMFDPPSRGAASPEINLQNLLAQQRHRQGQPSQESQQLLNLLRANGGTNSRPHSQQALPNNGAMTEADLQRFLQNQHRSPMPQEPHAPKPRVPQQAAGMFEEQLMRNFPQDQSRPDQGMMQGMPDMPQRRTSQRAPPGFYDDPSFIQQQQQQQQAMRRPFQDGPPQPPQPQQLPPGIGVGPNRRMSGHPNLPQMQIPQGGAHPQQQFGGPDFHQLTSPVGGSGGPPPPGFNPNMPRHPPGFHNINIFQNQGQQPQQVPRGAEGPPPPGFGGNGLQSPPGTNAPPGFFGGPGGGMGGPPPGFPPIRSPMEGGGLPPGFGMQRR